MSSKKPTLDLDLDVLTKLATTDPEAFEARRNEILDSFFADIPDKQKQRLQGLQWRIDIERQRASNPLSACIRIHNMMWSSFAGEGGLVSSFQKLEKSESTLAPTRKAQIISFSRS